jgi:transcription initiation factor TFIID subunit 7
MLKLKLGPRPPQGQDGDAVSTPPAAAAAAAAAAPSPTAAAAPNAPKLKLNVSRSQPPTPATEHPTSTPGPATQKKKAAPRKPSAPGGSAKKRGANDDISPAAKRPAQGPRKPSLLIKPPSTPSAGPESATPLTAAGGKLKLVNKLRQQSQVKKLSISAHNVKRPVPPRPLGVGYDSEDSEREEDPAIQQGLILRMQPGEDADKLHRAIAEGKVGLKASEGGLDVSIKFIAADLRRAVVRVQDRRYAAVLVDLPCIVESMKSWDRKGWWKVADIHQMLLVLGRVQGEEEAKNMELPKEVDPKTFQYAHGLTPPMHNARKHRFRKRVHHRQMENAEEEVERLLREDEAWELNNVQATVKVQEMTQAELDRRQDSGFDQDHTDYDADEMDADGEIVDSTEEYSQQGFFPGGEHGDDGGDDLEAMLAGALGAEDDEAPPASSDMIAESPATMGDHPASFVAAENILADDSMAETPAATPGGDAQDEQSSDEDESDFEEDDDDEADVVDEDAAARAAEHAQHMEEVTDLEREIAAAKAKIAATTNQLVRRREEDKMRKLEEDLRMKRMAFGLNEDD